jgi:hypothetical protein
LNAPSFVNAGYAAAVDLALLGRDAAAVGMLRALSDVGSEADEPEDEEPVIETNITELAAWVEAANERIGRRP